MAAADAPPKPERNDASPILIVVGTLVAVVLVTFVIFRIGGKGQDTPGAFAANLAKPVPAGACGVGTPADTSYSVDLATNPDPPVPEGATFAFTVRHNGQPVTGAKVCLTADMPEMQHPGISYVVNETTSGRYEAKIQFSMGGNWRTSVTINEPGKPVVSVPMTITVAQSAND